MRDLKLGILLGIIVVGVAIFFFVGRDRQAPSEPEITPMPVQPTESPAPSEPVAETSRPRPQREPEATSVPEPEETTPAIETETPEEVPPTLTPVTVGAPKVPGTGMVIRSTPVSLPPMVGKIT